MHIGRLWQIPPLPANVLYRTRTYGNLYTFRMRWYVSDILF